MSKSAKKNREKNGAASGSRARVILYSIAAVFCLAGLADATYLSVIAFTGETAACSGQAGCFEVLGSSYARVAGVPVALLGALGYFTAFTFAIFAAFNYKRAPKFFALTVCLMFAATLWFLYLQAFVLHAYCRYCLFSAAITFLLMGLVVATPSPRTRTE
ncbi:MAG TPA: vitamin K epoxide reductase family protein [Chthoniobacterales bacterium]|nr:vitamin K epoxide reductase family protein [Chthoniobacterales bacterium]